MSENSPRAYADRAVDAIIGENVHRLMWRNGDTQLSMAPLLGMSQGALSNKLKGKRPWFASEIDAVVARYNVSHGDLFDPAFTPEAPVLTVETRRFEERPVADLADYRSRRAATAAEAS